MLSELVFRLEMRNLLLLLLIHAFCDNVFRFGAVLSADGYTGEMKEARQGYSLFFDELNAKNDGRGIVLPTKKGTTTFAFKFNFTWMDDRSVAEVHERLVKELLDKDGPYDVHFLRDSHPTYAQTEMELANENKVLNYQ